MTKCIYRVEIDEIICVPSTHSIEDYERCIRCILAAVLKELKNISDRLEYSGGRRDKR